MTWNVVYDESWNHDLDEPAGYAARDVATRETEAEALLAARRYAPIVLEEQGWEHLYVTDGQHRLAWIVPTRCPDHPIHVATYDVARWN